MSPFDAMNILVVGHLVAILFAALALWEMRREISERAASRLRWGLAPALATGTAALLLLVSPGKRPELWMISIGVGFAVGLAAGAAMQGEKDFAQNLVRSYRTWDGVGAAALLLILALVRFVTTDLMHRPSGGFGVLGAGAAFLAAFQCGRVITLHLYASQRFTHYDMEPGQKRYRMSD